MCMKHVSARFQSQRSREHDDNPGAGTYYKGHSLESPEQRKLHESDEYLKMQMERYLDLRAQEGDALVLISGGAFRPGVHAKGGVQALHNRMLQGIYHPGHISHHATKRLT